MLQLPIYLDHNATTPCDPKVVEAMLPYFTQNFGNAASHHHPFGWKAKEAVDYAREQVANLIGASASEIIFTSGATEADNLAIKGIIEMYAGKGNHIITCNIEHKAVLDTCNHLEKLGAEVTYLQAKPDGQLDLNELEAAIRSTTILIAIMYANNEVGSIMPVREIGAIARKHGVIFFTDATQAVGKIPVHVENDNIDLLAMTGHKMYGPKGAGGLYVRRKSPRVRLTAQIDGGGHEKGLRSGTLNVPGIVGFGMACERCIQEMPREVGRLSTLRDKLERALISLEEVYINGSKENRLPHVTNLRFKDVDSNGLLMALQKNIALSSGSACTSATPEPSYVLKALGLSDELAHSSLRFSLGRYTTDEQIDYTVEQVSKAVKRLRGELAWRNT